MHDAIQKLWLPTAVMVVVVALTACGSKAKEAKQPSIEPTNYLVPSADPPGMSRVSVLKAESVRIDNLSGSIQAYGKGEDDDDPFVVLNARQYPAGQFREMRQAASPAERIQIHGLPGLVRRLHANERALPDGALSVVWENGPERMVMVSNASATREDLLSFSERVSIDPAGQPDVPAPGSGRALLGVLAEGWGSKPRLAARVGFDDGELSASLVTIPATPEEQAVYRALLAPNPRQVYGPYQEGEPGCCAPQTFKPPYALRVEGNTATIGMVDPFTRVLVLSGNPGVIVATEGNIEEAKLLSDEMLVALAKSLKSVSVQEFDALAFAPRGAALPPQRG